MLKFVESATAGQDRCFRLMQWLEGPTASNNQKHKKKRMLKNVLSGNGNQEAIKSDLKLGANHGSLRGQMH